MSLIPSETNAFYREAPSDRYPSGRRWRMLVTKRNDFIRTMIEGVREDGVPVVVHQSQIET
jgi:hypothetical protein